MLPNSHTHSWLAHANDFAMHDTVHVAVTYSSVLLLTYECVVSMTAKNNRNRSTTENKDLISRTTSSVSYTHLTLPTKRIV